MSDSISLTVSDKARVLGGLSQEIHFRPGAGMIKVHSVPNVQKAHTETGLLASAFLRPGNGKAVATARFKPPTSSIALAYNPTAADLAIPGEWTCEISNESLDPITFATEVTFFSPPPATATMDTEFLDLVLAKVVDAAAIQIHLESTDDGRPASHVSVSQDIAALLKVSTFTTFSVDDQHKTVLGADVVERIMNLDSDPEYPIVVLWRSPPGLKVIMRFDTTSARLVAQNLQKLPPDIRIEFFTIELNVGFDGSFQVVCNASAHLDFNNMDFSNDVMSGVQDALLGKLAKDPGFAALLDPKQLRAQIDRLFIQLMRLGPQAQVFSYGIDGQTLTVNYFLRTA